MVGPREKFIDGRLVNLETEDLSNLERSLQNVSKNEEKAKDDLDGLLSNLMSE